MSQHPDSTDKKLSEWLVNFVTLFRKQYQKLTEHEKKFVSISCNFNTPLQIEVFWLKHPEFQLVVYTHFEDRGDIEITIHEPLEGATFVKEVENVLKNPRWNKTYRIDSPIVERREQNYAYILAHEVFLLISNAKHTITQSYSKPIQFSTSPIGNSGWMEQYFGNVAEVDYSKKVIKIISQIRDGASYQPSEAKPVESSEWIKSYAAIVFPPIVIGKKPEPTIRDEILGHNQSFGGDEIVYDTKFEDIQIVVNKDGFIAVGTDDKRKALTILNTIMSIVTIEGIPIIAVREHELFETNINPLGPYVSGYTIPISLHGYLFEERYGMKVLHNHERREVEPEKIKRIVEKAITIINSEPLCTDIIFLLEACTHYENSEYPQSFMMSWIIIELEFKNLQMNETIRGLKKKRNKFIHAREPIRKEDSKKCFDIASDIVTKKVSSILSKN